MKLISILATLTLATVSTYAAKQAPTISGDYLEVRSCDVYTGPCFANSEMGLSGKEGILVWTVRAGTWNGAKLDGLSVIAVVRTDATLGDQHYQPRSGKAVLIVDALADARQRAALADLARTMSGKLVSEVAATRTASIEASIGTCSKSGCSSVKAGNLVEITTRCFGDKDHACGNEDLFYPPLTEVANACPAFTELAAFKGSGLNLTWESTSQRSAYLGTFAR
ncbi:MAG TPA: DUF1326 domain-containing protein [Verrucomicrobiae bacterium]|jgi:hypothetical protein